MKPTLMDSIEDRLESIEKLLSNDLYHMGIDVASMGKKITTLSNDVGWIKSGLGILLAFVLAGALIVVFG